MSAVPKASRATSGAAPAGTDRVAATHGGLAALARDANLVEPSARDWWTAYLSTHEQHLRTLVDLTLPWIALPGASHLLDVGSFPGQYAALMAKLGCSVTAIDIAPERAGRLWEAYGIDAWKRDIETETLPLAPGSVDVATLSEVLEHLRLNPFLCLQEIHRVLRPGGHLLVSVPYVSPRHRLRFLLGRDYQGDIVSEYRSLQEIGHMGHYRLLSRAEVSAMLRYTGYEIRLELVTGWLPGGRWSFVRFLGPFRDHFRSHYYVVAQKPLVEER